MISTTFFRQYLAVLNQRQIDISDFLQQQDINAEFLSDPNGRLDHHSHDLIWRHLLSYPPEQIRLNSNESLQPESLSPVVLVAMSCTTLLEALEALIALKNVGSDIQFELQKQADEVTIQISDAVNDLEYSRHYLSLTLQHLLDLIFWLTGTEVLPKRIVSDKNLTGLFEYEDKLSGLIQPAEQSLQAISNVVFASDDLNIALRISNPLIRQVLERQAHEALSRYSQNHSFRMAVTSHIKTYLEQNKQLPEAELTAKFLCMTTRTLQRKLKQENCSYRELGAKVRLEKIEELLRQDADTQRILYHTGLADSRALKNLVTRVSGKSWDEYRQLLK